MNHPLDINILPEQYRPTRISLAQIVGVVVMTAVLLGLLPTYQILRAIQRQTADLQTQLDQDRLQLTQSQSTRTQIEEQLQQVEQQIQDERDQVTHLRAELDTLKQQRIDHTAVNLAAVITALIPRLHLTTITQDGTMLTLSGEADSLALVLDYARALQASGRFTNVRILSLLNPETQNIAPDVQFIISVE